ncbi:MAG TPA: hypothetical protein VFG25_04105 [Nitrosopumilaceae archaeon]|nr:hypothetical protein [Nitrosopumilaceae archaeon]
MSRVAFERNSVVEKLVDIMITKPTIGLLCVGIFAAFIFLG